MSEDENNIDETEDKLTDQVGDATGDVEFDLESSAPSFKTKISDFLSCTSDKVKFYITKITNRKKTFEVPTAKTQEIERSTKITFKDKLQFKLKQLELGKLIQNIFAPGSRTKINQITIIVITAISLYGTGKILALALKGKESIRLTKVATQELNGLQISTSDINQIKINNIFKTISSGAPTGTLLTEKKKYTPEKCIKASRPTSLPLKLINTVVLQDTVKSVASVQVRGKLESFRAGENINSMAKIDKISRLELVIKNLKTGECESIRNKNIDNISTPKIQVMSPRQSRKFKHDKRNVKGITNNGNKFKIKKSLLNDKLKDLSALLTQARAIKITNPDGSLSFKIVEIDPGSIFSALGIQNEDIITNIGGEPIKSMNEIMALFGKLRNMSNLQLGVNRAGAPTALKYSFE
jgi:type II secretory pathway component PulC